MAVISDLDFGRQVCKILKLDASKVKDLTIFIKTGDVVMVQADMYLQDTEAPQVLKAMKDFVSDNKEDGENKATDKDGETLVYFNK